jgi:hypothetical protein
MMTSTPTDARNACVSLARTFDGIRATASDDTWMTSHAELLAHYPGNAPEHARTFDTLDAMRRYVESCGSHYFDRDAVRFFRGRTHRATTPTGLYAGRFWVESLQHVWTDHRTYVTTTEPREYRIAWVDNSGHAGVERLGSYGTLNEARAGARELAAAVIALDATHVDYPHHPGTLYDCPGCEARCWCTGADGEAECVFGADDPTTVHHGTREARVRWESSRTSDGS